MLHKNYYCDSFTVHDPTIASNDPHVMYHILKLQSHHGKEALIRDSHEEPEVKHDDLDTRRHLNDTWTKVYKYQPFWLIRNYFGEKIALYFAWCGCLITTLWLPMIFGLACFFYGLYLR